MPTGVFLDVYHRTLPNSGLYRFSDVRIVQYSANSVSNKEMPHNNTVEHKVDLEIVYHEMGDALSIARIFKNSVSTLTDSAPQIELYIIVDPSKDQLSSPNYSILRRNSADYPRFGPFIKTNVTQIAGTSTLVMQMTIEWTQHNLLDSPVSSFYTKSSFSIDETGATTIRKTGSLEVVKTQYDASKDKLPKPYLAGAADTSGTVNSVQRPNPNPLAPPPQGDSWRNDVVADALPDVPLELLPYPDYWRMFVAGNMYPGFRRVSQEYAVDESGCRLLFDVVDKEFFGNLPAPARVGNCQYTFERSIDDKNQAIGIKHFIASVKGDKNVTAGALLTLCIRMSQNRIDFRNDLIVKARVTQENMLTENAITFEIAAKATSLQVFTTAAGTGGSTSTSTGSITGSVPLGNILANIQTPQGVFQFVPAEMPPEYGISGIIRVVTAALPNSFVFPINVGQRASTIQLTPNDFGFDRNAAGVTYIFSDQIFDRFLRDDNAPADEDLRFRYKDWKPTQVPRGPNDGDGKQASASDTNADPAMASAYASNGYSSSKIQTGLIEVPAVAFNAKAKVFQCSAPRVNRVETVEASAKNRAPKRMFDDLKANSIVGVMDMNVSSGVPDLNGNRILSSVMTREVTLVPPPDLPTEGTGASPSDPSWEVVNKTFEGEMVRIVQYNPKSVPMPPSETQGIAPNYTPPSYTEGIIPQAYLA
jgi:hypothetical protein